MRSRTLLSPRLLGALAFAMIGCGLPANANAFGPDSFEAGPQWNGFYAGGQLGGAWNNTDWSYANRNWFNTIGPAKVIDTFDMDANGVIGGGQLGYNFQAGSWVLGAEWSLAAADLDTSRSSPAFPTDRYTASYNALTTVVGRLGYAAGSWLAYAKAGYAGADVDLTLFDPGTPVRASDTTWANGWTVGGGVEFKVSQAISLGVDYGYASLDTSNWELDCASCPTGFAGGGVPVVEGDITVQSVTARLNFLFGR
jgi:outer membrane immunogenic protein